MQHQDVYPRPFTDDEYTLIVLQDVKRFLRKSELGLSWIKPRHWSANEADRRQVTDAIDNAIEAVREQVERQQSGRERTSRATILQEGD